MGEERFGSLQPDPLLKQAMADQSSDHSALMLSLPPRVWLSVVTRADVVDRCDHAQEAQLAVFNSHSPHIMVSNQRCVTTPIGQHWRARCDLT